jgi:hypothetical protein
MPATTTKSPLAARFGHETRFDQHLASQLLPWILASIGATPTGAPEFQVRVPCGDDGKQGRLDILQATDAGVVIVETQYGTSNSSHLQRLEGYASNFDNTLCVVWAAERFKDEHVRWADASRANVYCAVLQDQATVSLEWATDSSLIGLTGSARLAQAKKREDSRAKMAYAHAKDTYKQELLAHTRQLVEEDITFSRYGGLRLRGWEVTPGDIVDEILSQDGFSTGGDGRYCVSQYGTALDRDDYGIDVPIPDDDKRALRAAILSMIPTAPTAA